MLIRLDKYLADMQVGTRSEVKELIRKKRVTVNDSIVTKPELKINTDGDSVNVDGNAVGYMSILCLISRQELFLQQMTIHVQQ